MQPPTTSILHHQHAANLAVLLFSALAAWLFPLETFLIAGVVIGPFHYLTEIAWLRKKQFYFTSGLISPTAYLVTAVVLCGLAALDLRLHRGWTAYAVGGLLVLSFSALVRSIPVLVGMLALVAATRFFIHGYGLFLAAFVPTVLHVYVFTLLFLVSGALRGKHASRFGAVNSVLLLALPVALLRLPATLPMGLPGHAWMNSETLFAPVHEYIAGLLGLGMHFNAGSALSPNAILIFRFLAFIYLHHYLNWFAKTELLAWHKVSRRSWATVLCVYAMLLGSYFFSFALGFYATYALSLLHVLLELPLNWQAGASIARHPWKRWRARATAQAAL